MAQVSSAATTLKVQGNIGYFVTDSQLSIQRYDFASESWISPIVLAAPATGFALSPDKLYAAYGRRIEQMNLDGTVKTFLNNAATDVIDLMLDGNVLFANRSSGLYADFTSYDAVSGAQISVINGYPHSAYGSSICPTSNKIFGRTSGLSPSDIVSVAYSDAGQLGSVVVNSPYHGDYPSATRTWCFPNGINVLDNSGTVYTTADMRFAGSLGNTVLSVGFVGGDSLIALTSGKLVAYSNAIVETGRYTLTNANANTMHVHEGKIFAFYPSTTASGLAAETVLISALNVATAGSPVSPVGLAYTYNQIVSDGVANLYVLSSAHKSVFRWNIDLQRYLPTISLPEQGTQIAYVKSANQLFVSTTTQRIYRIDLNALAPAAIVYTQTPKSVSLLLPMRGDLLVAQNGSWSDNWIYDSNGQLLGSNSCCYNNFVHFDATRDFLYFANHRISYLGGGQFSNANPLTYSSSQFVGFPPNGLYAAAAQGAIVNLDTAQTVGYLANEITHAGWLDPTILVSLERNSVAVGYQRLQRWASNFDLAKNVSISGASHDLQILGTKAVVAAQLNGAPNFTVFDASLNVLPPKQWDAPTLSVNRFSVISADLSWLAIQGEEEVLLETSSISNPTWQNAGTVERDRLNISATLVGPDVYRFRVRAHNNGVYSPYSNIAEIDTRSTSSTVVDPRAVTFIPDDAFLSEDGKAYLLSSNNRSIFVWDIARQNWLQTIPLRGNARFMTYMPQHKAIFTSYDDGRLFAVSLEGASAELVFGDGPLLGTCGLVAADHVLVACDNYGSWESNTTFSPSGALIDTHDWRYPFNGGVWSPVNRRVYHLRDNTSPNDLLSFTVGANGILGSQIDSPYHTSEGIGHPVRVSPTGNVVILGPGRVFDAITLQYAGNLPRPMTDAVWMGSRLLTSNGAQIDAHDPITYALASPSRTLNRPILRLLQHGRGKLVVLLARADGGTELRVLDSDLQDVEKPLFTDSFE